MEAPKQQISDSSTFLPFTLSN